MHGILPLWKEAGMTSHDCVFKVRKILGTKKVGHTGTLDPAVEGVLPICIGHATRLAEYIQDAGKTYEAIISIGKATTTEDAEGDIVLNDSTEKTITREQLLAALAQLTGEITQTPPMFSAVKVNGRRLYDYARAGETVERPSRIVKIHALELLDDATQYSGETIEFALRIQCGKGTYIRTLSVQIGEILGYPAHMKSLVRTMSGTYTQQQCVTLAQLKELTDAGEASAILRPVETALEDYPSAEITAENRKDILNGAVLPMHTSLLQSDKIVFMENNKAVAVYIAHPTKAGLMKPEKMFPKVD
ncbi:tRNA pseudouridine(55) synthase TruB [Kurthia sibirica]|uniref:tRNA pseudouridine synthase B n=1 Tax=Kurthia sibirica TaxID=202750 RepID=A0A2U3ARB6_9BACL|nr:tRNA pseudouridine(55) synthase TruB [Kurthia sibirica]PWI27046.1 tRNA pseudouridine(55) synthase TruB [Kurthia sibirica]